MGMILRLGWRNLFRNKRRTFLTALITALGLGSLIFIDALMQGMVDNMVATATGTFLGSVQVHAEGFRSQQKVEMTVKDLPGVERKLKADPRVAAYAERVLSGAMITSAADVESVLVVGVDPKEEDGVSKIRRAVREGADLSGDGSNGILLGKRLARTLQVGLGDRVVLTAAKAGSGELSQEMFRVRGLFEFNTAEMDRGMVFVERPRAQRMLGLGGAVHEVALRLSGGNGSEPKFKDLTAALNAEGNEAVDWGHLLPDLKAAVELTAFSSAILALLLAGVVALAILNTLFMSLYERMFEFGVLRALGTRPGRLALMVVSEAASLGLFSILLGTALGFLVVAAVAQVGVNYSGIEFAGVTLQDSILPRARWLQATVFPAGVWVFTVLISLYPAWHAAKLVPAKALHRSLG